MRLIASPDGSRTHGARSTLRPRHSGRAKVGHFLTLRERRHSVHGPDTRLRCSDPVQALPDPLVASAYSVRIAVENLREFDEKLNLACTACR